ncbi:MAG TPA: Gfo/Idh/MocA family oxidoreductase [Chloroflexota bacterium]|nr:Gfo/Idh/MocA family oxidoreductase [Chloroflexota bacterium]
MSAGAPSAAQGELRFRPLRIGIIGTGGIARSAHLPAYARLDTAELTAICDVSRQAVDLAGEQFQVPAERRYTDYRALLARDDVDAVDICTPNQVRLEPLLAACAAGKHVLVQKPMARSIEEANQMIAAARTAGVKLGVIYMGRFSPGHALVQRLMEAGAIGRVTALREKTGHSGGLRLPQESWRRSFDNVAGSWSLLSAHTADRFRMLAGPGTSICAMGKTLVSPMTGDDNFSATLEFASGSLGTMEACYHMIPADNILEVYGDRGTIHTSSSSRTYRVQTLDGDPAPWAEHLNGLVPTRRDDGWWYFDLEQVRAAQLRQFPNYFAHWVDCLQHSRDPVTPGEEGRASLEIILAGYRSSAERRFVDLEWQTW